MIKQIKNLIKAVLPKEKPRPLTTDEALAMVFDDIRKAHEKLDKVKK